MIYLKALLNEATLDFQVKGKFDPEDIKTAVKLLYRYFEEKDTLNWLYSHSWKLIEVKNGHTWIDGERYEFEYSPKKGREMDKKPFPDATWTNKVKVFRTPKETVDYTIASNMERYGNNFVFRGMNMAEWISAKKQGYIKSNAAYNLGGIELTYFGKEWGTAHSYAGGFAPFDKDPTRSLPGVIIAVPKELTKNAKDVTGQNTETEYVAEKIPIDQVKGVWYIVPTQMGTGNIELVLKNGKLDRGSASPPHGNRYVIIPKAGIAL